MDAMKEEFDSLIEKIGPHAHGRMILKLLGLQTKTWF